MLTQCYALLVIFFKIINCVQILLHHQLNIQPVVHLSIHPFLICKPVVFSSPLPMLLKTSHIDMIIKNLTVLKDRTSY